MKKIDRIYNVFYGTFSYSLLICFFISPVFIYYSLFQKWYIPKVETYLISDKPYFKWTEELNIPKLIITIVFGIFILIVILFKIFEFFYDIYNRRRGK